MQEGHNNEPSCVECGSVYKFTTDAARGDIYCSECGAVYDNLRIVSNGYKAVFAADGGVKSDAPRNDVFDFGFHGDTVAVSLGSLRNSSSAPYKRTTYLSERLSQWRQREPEINWKDWCLIKWKYQDKFGFEKTYIPTKEDIRQVLRAIDIQRNVQRFVRKYLEKFLTIRYRLCGVKSHGVDAPEWIDDEIKRMFALVEAPFDRLVRDKSIRSSFPNYNFCFRRFFDILGCPQYNEDFPPLKSQKKREDIILIWLKLIHYLKWPYLNTDGANFGSEYRINARELLRRRRRHASKRRPPDSDTTQRQCTNANTKRQHRSEGVRCHSQATGRTSDGESTETEQSADTRAVTATREDTDASASRYRWKTDNCQRTQNKVPSHESLADILVALSHFDHCTD
jgi:hypothetical protein